MAFIRFIYGSSLGIGYIPAKSLKEGDEIVNPADGSVHTVERIYGAELIEDDSNLNGMGVPNFTEKNNPIQLDDLSSIVLTREPNGFKTSIVPTQNYVRGWSMPLTPEDKRGSESIAVADGDLQILAGIGDISSCHNKE